MGRSIVGCVRPERETLLPLEEGKVTLPSVVFFNADDGHTYFGRAAPYAFDPAVPAAPAEKPEPAAEKSAKKPRRAIWGGKKSKAQAEEPKPSMFPAPEAVPAAAETEPAPAAENPGGNP